MASINSLMSSTGSTSSIYGNSNIISGLASGMDTEAMIENAVSGIKDRIAGLNQDKTMLEWEQNAYRSIIDKLAAFSDNYLSYTSSTNLLSASFYNNATKVSALGTYSNLVSATGNPSSSVKILGVSQLASAATYSAGIGGTGRGFTSREMDLDGQTTASAVSGSLTLEYNGVSATLDFGEEEYADTTAFVTAINEKLAKTNLAGEDGVKAVQDGTGFKFVGADGKEVKITAASGALKDTLGIEVGDTDKTYATDGKLINSKTVLENMIGKEFSFTLDGVTKTITLDENDKTAISGADDKLKKLAEILNTKTADAFGADKVEVTAAEGKLTFNTVNAGSSLKITNAEELSLSSTATSYVNTSQKISELVSNFQNFKNDEGGYSFTINGKDLSVDENTTIGQLMNMINENEEIGVKVSFSQFSNSFQFTAKETGSAGKVQFGEMNGDDPADLAAALFGVANDTGKDAILSLEVNGVTMTDVTRSSNDISIDGMTVKLKGTFTASAADAVSFEATADADKIVKTLKEMVEAYNTVANEIREQYATQPLRDSKGKRYEPLLAKDADEMSEKEIEKYEKKAKTGILFGDSDLSALYDEMRSAISSLDLEAIGITTKYESGKTTLSLDETKLRSVLENDPNKVRDTLTKSKADGASQDGMLTRLQSTINKYAKTSGATRGILVNLAGSEKSPLSLTNNDYKTKFTNLEEQIARWEAKLSTKIDYYTKQFTALEKMISDMNAQSSALAGMMGY